MFDLGSYIHNNTALVSAISLVAGGCIFASLKNLPLKFVDMIKRQFTTTLLIDSDEMTLINYINAYCCSDEKLKKAKLISAKLDIENNILYVPAPGGHLIWFKNRPIWLSFSKTQRTAQSVYTGDYVYKYYFTTLGRKNDLIKSFCKEMELIYKIKSKKIPEINIIDRHAGYWTFFKKVKIKKEESLILDKNIKDNIFNDLENFYNNKEWYEKLGIPYHRGYLFYGVPGAGKSSIIQLIASKYNKNINIINLNYPNLNDQGLVELFQQAKDIIIIEDIDAVFLKRNSDINNKNDEIKQKSNVTFSGLLNVLDGALAPEGTVVIMTTNHIEKLDHALIRPGRVDMKVYFDYASKYQIKTLFERFYPDDANLSEIFADKINSKISMAQLQGYFIERYHSVEKTFHDIEILNQTKNKEEIVINEDI